MGSVAQRVEENGFRGFTLIEIIIALAIVAFTVTVAIPAVTRVFGENLKSSARKLAGTVKYTYHQAIIRNKTMRLVYDFREDKYWAEIAGDRFMLIERNDTSGSLREEEEEIAEMESSFTEVAEKLLSPKNLDSGVKFRSVFSSLKGELIEDGRAYTHFFPDGTAECSVVNIAMNEKVMGLAIEPMLGMAEIFDEYVEQDFCEKQ